MVPRPDEMDSDAEERAANDALPLIGARELFLAEAF
jgi:hypothetical protein